MPGGSSSLGIGVNADGAVVVGYGDGTGFGQHAFRWTSAGMEDLGTMPGGSYSLGYGVSADGTAVVGYGDGTGFSQHAFRWTSAGMEDLGTLPGGTSSLMLWGVSADGAVVVGYGDGTGFGNHAFRWTAATGMRDLNTLLADAGVNMTGITLDAAYDVSANGQFIVGQGNFSGATHAYIVRYFDNEGTPIAGLTTPGAVQESINGLGDARFGLMAQEHGLAVPLLGDNQPIKQGNEAGVFGTAGSAQGGGYSRVGLMPGLALLTGAAYGSAEFENAAIDDSFIGAAALRYVKPNPGRWHPFAEGGGWFAPDADLKFERTYMNGAGTATGTGRTEGDVSYVFARGGLVFDLGPRHQLALSAELGREWLDVDGYSEPLSAKNPFEANVASGTDTMDLAKARAQWSFGLSQRFDATLWAAAVYGFNQKSELIAAVTGVGTFVPVIDDETVWAEYGARIGYAVTEAVTLDLFFDGVSGEEDEIATRVHGGAGLRYRF